MSLLMIIESGSSGPAPDTGEVVLLMHYDGTDGNTVLEDASSISNFCLAVGSAQLTTSNAKFGPSSLNLAAGGQACGLISPPDASIHFDNLEWTVEAWVYNSGGLGDGRYILAFNTGGASQLDLNTYGGSPYYYRATVRSVADNPVATVDDASVVAVLNQWQFIQVRRRNSGAHAYIEMAVDGNMTSSADLNSATYLKVPTSVIIGAVNTDGGLNHKGQIDDLRVTVGEARDFAIPTAPFPHP